jgi:translation initiation factor IF-1
MLAKRTVKNQITLPKKVADAFPGIDHFDVKIDDGRIVLAPVQPDRIEQVRVRLAELGVTERDVVAAVRWARRRKA